MSNTFTDKEMQIFSQLAYLSLSSDVSIQLCVER